MKHFLLIVTLSSILFVNCAWAPNAETKKAIVQKEAYFKNPKNDVLFVIAAVDLDNGAELFEKDIEVVITTSDGRSSDTFRTRTPYIIQIPMDEIISRMLEEYNKTSGMYREKFLMQATLEAPSITIMAQSQASFAGVAGHVYFAGKEISHDTSAIEYGAVNLIYTLPLRELLEAEK